MRKIFLLLASIVALASCSTPQIDVLLLTGHTDKWHNTDVMSRFIVKLLGEYEPFKVDVLAYESEATFNPDFEAYDVVVLNQNETTWNETAKRNFEKYVANGGGVVVVHEADNAHPDWVEYNRIIGLGGWGGRTEVDGDYYYWLDGEYVRDRTSGNGGRHGRRVPFDINVRNAEHPIMKGLPQKWEHLDDELYGNLRGPAEQIEVLATAYSTAETGGSGKEEPILFTIGYGKGRVFHTVLGHTAKNELFLHAIANRGFQVTLSRGVEWAATGDVKQTDTNVEGLYYFDLD